MRLRKKLKVRNGFYAKPEAAGNLLTSGFAFLQPLHGNVLYIKQLNPIEDINKHGGTLGGTA